MMGGIDGICLELEDDEHVDEEDHFDEKELLGFQLLNEYPTHGDPIESFLHLPSHT